MEQQIKPLPDLQCQNLRYKINKNCIKITQHRHTEYQQTFPSLRFPAHQCCVFYFL